VGNRIVGKILDYWRRFVIVVRVEVACGIGVSCRCKVLVKGDINRAGFLFCIIVLGHKVHACVQVGECLRISVCLCRY
jgi:hypothetical protein